MCNNFFLSLECVPCNEVVTDRSGNAGKLLLLVKGVHVNNGVGRILVMNVRWVGSDVPQTGPDFPERTVMTLSRLSSQSSFCLTCAASPSQKY